MNESSSCRRSALCVGSFGLACGVLWAGAILIIGIVAMHVQYGQPFVEAVGHLYVGYALTVKGVIMGVF
jgi:hypothetical protein